MTNEVAIAVPAVASPVVSPKAAAKPAKIPKVAKPKATNGKPSVPKTHPAYADMIKKAIGELKEKKGSSRAAILKYIVQSYKVGENLPTINAHLRLALKRGVATGLLKQVTGTGAAGSFKLGEKVASVKSKVIAKPKVVVAGKSKKSAPISKPKKAAALTLKMKTVVKPKIISKKAVPAKPKAVKTVAPTKKPAPAKKSVVPVKKVASSKKVAKPAVKKLAPKSKVASKVKPVKK